MFRHDAGGGGDEDEEEEASKRLLLEGWAEGGTHPGALGSRAARGGRLLDTVKKGFWNEFDKGMKIKNPLRSRTEGFMVLNIQLLAGFLFPHAWIGKYHYDGLWSNAGIDDDISTSRTCPEKRGQRLLLPLKKGRSYLRAYIPPYTCRCHNGE